MSETAIAWQGQINDETFQLLADGTVLDANGLEMTEPEIVRAVYAAFEKPPAR